MRASIIHVVSQCRVHPSDSERHELRLAWVRRAQLPRALSRLTRVFLCAVLASLSVHDYTIPLGTRVHAPVLAVNE